MLTEFPSDRLTTGTSLAIRGFMARITATDLALHTDDAVRVSAQSKTVKSGDVFRTHTTAQMEQFKKAGYEFTLTLRFTERVHGNDAAFETGVYRFESKDGAHIGYGNFRVLLRKVDGVWKVALDADQPADAAAFEAARPLEDVDWK